MKISIIVAAGEKNEIGKDNRLMWKLSSDMKRFRSLTTGHTIVMGRKTFESLPKGALPERKNVLITKDKNYRAEGCFVFHSVDEAIEGLKDDGEIFIIGGAELYRSFIDKCDKLYLTRVHASFPDADAFFPNIDIDQWRILTNDISFPDEKNNYPSSFWEMERK